MPPHPSFHRLFPVLCLKCAPMKPRAYKPCIATSPLRGLVGALQIAASMLLNVSMDASHSTISLQVPLWASSHAQRCASPHAAVAVAGTTAGSAPVRRPAGGRTSSGSTPASASGASCETEKSANSSQRMRHGRGE